MSSISPCSAQKSIKRTHSLLLPELVARERQDVEAHGRVPELVVEFDQSGVVGLGVSCILLRIRFQAEGLDKTDV